MGTEEGVCYADHPPAPASPNQRHQGKSVFCPLSHPPKIATVTSHRQCDGRCQEAGPFQLTRS